MSVGRTIVACGGLVLMLAGLPVRAGTAKGTLEFKGKTYTLQYGYAVARQGAFDPNAEDIELWLSVSPISDDDLAGMIPGEGPRLSVTVDAQQHVVTGAIMTDTSSFSTNTGHEVALTAFTPEHVAGRLFTKGPITAASSTFRYDVTFDATVFRKPKAVEITPADKQRAAASPQAKAFSAYLKALHAGDKAALGKMVAPDLAAQMSEPMFDSLFPLMQQMAPKQVDYLRLTESGDSATLEMQSDEGQGKGKTTFQKVGGAWKVGKTSWSMGQE